MTSLWRRTNLILVSTSVLIIAALSLSCDPQRKKKCEWYITPFPEGNTDVQEGHVSLCITNFELKRKRCHYSSTLAFAEKHNGVAFRFVDVEHSDSFPRVLQSLGSCKPNGS